MPAIKRMQGLDSAILLQAAVPACPGQLSASCSLLAASAMAGSGRRHAQTRCLSLAISGSKQKIVSERRRDGKVKSRTKTGPRQSAVKQRLEVPDLQEGPGIRPNKSINASGLALRLMVPSQTSSIAGRWCPSCFYCPMLHGALCLQALRACRPILAAHASALHPQR